RFFRGGAPLESVAARELSRLTRACFPDKAARPATFHREDAAPARLAFDCALSALASLRATAAPSSEWIHQHKATPSDQTCPANRSDPEMRYNLVAVDCC